jgi:hypothetical protein
MSQSEEVKLNSTLVTAVIEIIDFYSKKGVFKVSEYKDIATITERLTEVKTGYEKNDKSLTPFTMNELAFIIQIFKEGSQRVPTSVDSFGQIFAVYQHFTKVLEQEVEKEKAKENDSSIPTIDELNES